MLRLLAALLVLSLPLRAEGERPGDYDYLLLSLSWSPTWCALEGDAGSGRRTNAVIRPTVRVRNVRPRAG